MAGVNSIVCKWNAENEEWEVEGILEHKKLLSGKMEYLVKWFGFEVEDATWQGRKDLANASTVLSEYEDLVGLSQEKHPKEILDHRVSECGETEYFVKWVGLGTTGKTWQAREEIAKAPRLVAEYEDKKGLDGEWEVEGILQHRKSDNGLEFLVKWAGWDANDATWQTVEDLSNAQSIVDEYISQAGLESGGFNDTISHLVGTSDAERVLPYICKE